MTFKELQDEVILLRFNEKRRASVKSWLNLRYRSIWNRAEWTFKRVPPASLAIVAGNRQPVTPDDFAKAHGLYDQNGQPLLFLDPDTWEQTFIPDTSVGTPGFYTVIDRQIFVGPTPQSSATFKLPYKRRLSHVDSLGNIFAGLMSADDDEPIWPAEHDYVLIFEAAITGMQFDKDESWQELVGERDAYYAEMRSDLLSGVDVPMQFGS